ncbi:MAG: hopanoid biosynthesis associated radical SAM protein HpnH [Gammaproteobacteria bacterium RIFCSPLOWO2_02_FULL_52_10]|nr:MAG: hopanoid biosynthesis associated radical SAM protein HpnH [Gammaproteobacteria bacterium RIFCSPLOWO2_02_FULL_52_10]OGT84327.1 MAG: hopanoid biosynthesis associated radical SAM protein HpnH [Gammaproteobacteria bacterium RIFCSPLOWO2_12_FULL_52_10]
MGVPLIQQYRVGKYILGKKLSGEKRYPLVLMLEPLFRCNLACAGCGKIDYPDDTLDKRLSYDDCMQAIDECGAPIVSIAGGEPLIHKEMPKIVTGFIQKKKFVYLCTNALLLPQHIHEYTPSPYLTFSIHLDGNQDRHDASVCREGVFNKCIKIIKVAIAKGFRVTLNCTLFQGESADEVSDFMDMAMTLGVEGVTISPGYSYQRAPKQDVFLQRQEGKQLFRKIFDLGKNKRWRFNQSSLYLDFLAGNQTYECTPWGNPTRNIFGWQKPCYLLVEEGYEPTFTRMMHNTEWDKYGTGRNPKCANCMVHCGYEPTAVNDLFKHPWKGLKVALSGPRTEGPMAPELPILYDEQLVPKKKTIEIKPAAACNSGNKQVA